MSASQRGKWGMSSMRADALLLPLLLLSTSAAHAAISCWGEPIAGPRVDLNGDGKVHGAWVLGGDQVSQRLRAGSSLNVLLPGYDSLAADSLCRLADGSEGRLRVVFGGRERFLAQQGEPAWSWLIKSADDLAGSLVLGDLKGIFVGKDKVVVGRSLSRRESADPAQLAADLLQREVPQPVVIFVSEELQQHYLAFFANNPLPGVFLSFDEPERVRDALNKYAKFHAEEQAGLLNYYCD